MFRWSPCIHTCFPVFTLAPPRVFGEDYILESERIKDTSCARAINYLEVFASAREDVLAIGERYPQTMKKVRKKVLFRTMRKAIVRDKDLLIDSLSTFRGESCLLPTSHQLIR